MTLTLNNPLRTLKRFIVRSRVTASRKSPQAESLLPKFGRDPLTLTKCNSFGHTQTLGPRFLPEDKEYPLQVT